MKIIENRNDILHEDLKQEIKKGSKLSIIAATFSMYAYEALKKELENIDELRFVFNSPTFVKDAVSKEKREFYIPRLNRERSLYGTEFEVKLRNEMTQKAIAKECAKWIKNKVTFKSNVTSENMFGFIIVDEQSYMPVNAFTTVDLGCERGNNAYMMIQKTHASENANQFINNFEEVWNDTKRLQDVTDTVVESISSAYKENAPDFIYFFVLYNIFNEFLEDISEDELPNEATGFKQSKIWNMLYDFQKDAALAVIKYYKNRNKSVLVLCPKKLSENWNTYKGNYINNPIAEDRLRYDVLYHTDLSRVRGMSNGIDLERLNWGNYDLVVIDESHNFRNGGEISGDDGKENRYLKLLNQVVRKGVRTKVLMLSTTPVNNRFKDLKNQLALAYEGDSAQMNAQLATTKSINDIFRLAQKSFNEWTDLPLAECTTDVLLDKLDFDFFELLDSVTIARSRKHIEKYYSTADIGQFPTRRPPISVRPCLTDLVGDVNYNSIYDILMSLNLTIYTPSNFIMPSKVHKYIDKTHNKGTSLTQKGREEGIRRLMSINLLKRLESSVYSFRLTIARIKEYIESTINTIKAYKNGMCIVDVTDVSFVHDFDEDDQNKDCFTVGKKIKIDLADMDYLSWLHDLEADAARLARLVSMMATITPEHDTKLQTLFDLIREKITHPINEGNRKIIIFTAFSNTADYLYQHVSAFVKHEFGLDTAEITGSVDGKTTVPGLRADLNTVLTCFSPKSKHKELLFPNSNDNIDVLIATDCISEGQNLQDCDYLVNYDIHWNPVRIIQRFGRIDRIGSINATIQLVNFWPDMDLDDYIKLKARVETRMRITVMTSTGDDDLLNAEEQGDLAYRRAQLKRLQEKVVDIEDMSSGISIMDLGLNEFRLDLLEYMKHHHDVEKTPYGMHAVVPQTDDAPAGVIFILRNVNDSVNIDQQNRIHPFYMVYVAEDGDTVCDYLHPKSMLDALRFLCKGHETPYQALCQQFNQETDDGRNMEDISDLLEEAIHSIIDVKEESDVDSLFRKGGTTALLSEISGMEDFELICFVVVK